MPNAIVKWGAILCLMGASSAAMACGSPTPALTTYPYPNGRIPYGNDLSRPAGKTDAAVGQKLIVQGVVLDARCRPVKDAIVELWQADQFGKYMLATGEDMVSAGPVFTGAGRTFTQSDGGFQFITLFPGAVGKRTPNLNIRVNVDGLKRPLSTQLFFAGDARNEKDPIYRWTKPASRDRVTVAVQPIAGIDGVSASIEIVLPQNLSYLTY